MILRLKLLCIRFVWIVNTTVVFGQQPGAKPLLLSKMLSQQSALIREPTYDEDAARRRPTDRRKLSMSQRVMLDAERDRVIQLYREQKRRQQHLTYTPRASRPATFELNICPIDTFAQENAA